MMGFFLNVLKLAEPGAGNRYHFSAEKHMLQKYNSQRYVY